MNQYDSPPPMQMFELPPDYDTALDLPNPLNKSLDSPPTYVTIEVTQTSELAGTSIRTNSVPQSQTNIQTPILQQLQTVEVSDTNGRRLQQPESERTRRTSPVPSSQARSSGQTRTPSVRRSRRFRCWRPCNESLINFCQCCGHYKESVLTKCLVVFIYPLSVLIVLNGYILCAIVPMVFYGTYYRRMNMYFQHTQANIKCYLV
jgi:hypothetical protein